MIVLGPSGGNHGLVKFQVVRRRRANEFKHHFELRDQLRRGDVPGFLPID